MCVCVWTNLWSLMAPHTSELWWFQTKCVTQAPKIWNITSPGCVKLFQSLLQVQGNYLELNDSSGRGGITFYSCDNHSHIIHHFPWFIKARLLSLKAPSLMRYINYVTHTYKRPFLSSHGVTCSRSNKYVTHTYNSSFLSRHSQMQYIKYVTHTYNR